MDGGVRRLGRYEIVRPLGEGGAGEVYEAVLNGPGTFTRRVALKVLKRQGEALRREARIGGLLRHRNLVDMYEVGQVDGRWFCAMELCEGGALSQYAPLPPRAVVEVGLQVCAAMRYAHEARGLVHLDIKPSNLLLADGVVKVADLGIAQAQGFVNDGRLRGTPGYIAPERASGGCDPRADIYALGVTLAVLAGGAAGAAGVTLGGFSTLSALESDSLVGTLASGGASDGRVLAPDWLAPVVERCLAEEPGERWPDMAALAEALRGLAVGGTSLWDTVGWSPALAQPDEPGLGASDAFFGRAEALGDIAERLAAPSLLTLKGPAGVGKSRLAAAVARGWEGQAWFCELAGARTLDGLLFAVARCLDVPLARGSAEAQAAQLGDALAARGDVVLVLDDVEPGLGLSPTVARWRERCEALRIVVTSREPLGLRGEQVLEVGPLSEDAAQALLVERALRRGVDIAGEPALLALARRLDCLPLALELAAGRLGVLSVQDVLEDFRLSLLRTGGSGRHDTLLAAMAGSWRRLTEVERAWLSQLSVFAEGFTLEAAEAVLAPDGASILDVVDELVRRSLVAVGAGGRFKLLLTIQDYAAERLAEPTLIERRHGQHFAAYGARAVVDREGRGALKARRALALEVDNLAAACRRAIERGDGAIAVDTLVALWAVMGSQGPFGVAASLGERVIALPGLSERERARALSVLGDARRYLGGMDASRASLEAGLEAARGAGAVGVEGEILRGLGALASEQGQHAAAIMRFEEALVVHREAGDARGESRTLTNLGVLYRRGSRFEEAARCFESALRAHRAIGSRRWEGIVLSGLGDLHADQSEPAAALRRYTEALEALQDAGDRRSVGITLDSLGELHREQGRMTEALRCLEEALAIPRRLGDRRSEAQALNGLAIFHHNRGALSEARARYEPALAIFDALDDARSAAIVRNNLGLIHKEEGRHVEAMAAYDDAMAAHRAGGNRMWEGRTLLNIGDLRAEQGRREAALSCYKQALQIQRQVSDRRSEGEALRKLGVLYAEAGQRDEASAHYQAALAIHRAIGNRRSEGIALQNLADLKLAAGDTAAALSDLQVALAIHQEVENEAWAALARATLVEIIGRS